MISFIDLTQDNDKQPSPEFQEPKCPFGRSKSKATVRRRRGSCFRSIWIDQFDWLRYDGATNTMFCVFCRRWADQYADTRSSLSVGSSNFRLEILHHHDRCKAHRMCADHAAQHLRQLRARRHTVSFS